MGCRQFLFQNLLRAERSEPIGERSRSKCYWPFHPSTTNFAMSARFSAQDENILLRRVYYGNQSSSTGYTSQERITSHAAHAAGTTQGESHRQCPSGVDEALRPARR